MFPGDSLSSHGASTYKRMASRCVAQEERAFHQEPAHTTVSKLSNNVQGIHVCQACGMHTLSVKRVHSNGLKDLRTAEPLACCADPMRGHCHPLRHCRAAYHVTPGLQMQKALLRHNQWQCI